MAVSGELFSNTWLVFFLCVEAIVLWFALRWARWNRLLEGNLLSVFLGASVSLMVLWALRTEIEPGYAWHLAGIVSLTLMFGWALAIICGHIALIGVTLTGFNDWLGFFPSALLLIFLPASIAKLSLSLARVYLPKHYFIYVFVNAFLTGGLAASVTAITTAILLYSVGAYTWGHLSETYLAILPLMFFPEGVLNGWMVAIMVGYKPHWIRTFRDEEYLQGK